MSVAIKISSFSKVYAKWKPSLDPFATATLNYFKLLKSITELL